MNAQEAINFIKELRQCVSILDNRIALDLAITALEKQEKINTLLEKYKMEYEKENKMFTEEEKRGIEKYLTARIRLYRSSECEEWRNCVDDEMQHPDKAIEIIENYLKEHPAKTYEMDFKEKHSKAIMSYNGSMCTRKIYHGKDDCPILNKLEKDCKECWRKEMSEC